MLYTLKVLQRLFILYRTAFGLHFEGLNYVILLKHLTYLYITYFLCQMLLKMSSGLDLWTLGLYFWQHRLNSRFVCSHLFFFTVVQILRASVLANFLV